MDYDLIQTIVGVVGLGTILLLWWQIRSGLEWEKIKISLNQVDLSLLETNGYILSDAGIDLTRYTLNDDEEKILLDEKNTDVLYALRDILNMLERFATLYNMKVLNKKIVYESFSEDTLFYYRKFEKIIEYHREKIDRFYYTNLKKCAKEFLKKNEEEEKKIKKIKKLQDEL